MVRAFGAVVWQLCASAAPRKLRVFGIKKGIHTSIQARSSDVTRSDDVRHGRVRTCNHTVTVRQAGEIVTNESADIWSILMNTPMTSSFIFGDTPGSLSGQACSFVYVEVQHNSSTLVFFFFFWHFLVVSVLGSVIQSGSRAAGAWV